MENIFNPKTPENSGYGIKEKAEGISANKILCAAAGSFIIGTTLKIAGKTKTGSKLKKWTLPLLALGLYRKFTQPSALETSSSETNEYNANTLKDDLISG